MHLGVQKTTNHLLERIRCEYVHVYVSACPNCIREPWKLNGVRIILPQLREFGLLPHFNVSHCGLTKHTHVHIDLP